MNMQRKAGEKEYFKRGGGLAVFELASPSNIIIIVRFASRVLFVLHRPPVAQFGCFLTNSEIWV